MDLLFLIFILEIFFVITILFLTGKNIELLSYLLFSSSIFLVVISFYTNITISFLLSIASVFIYGSYVLYQVIQENQTVLAVRENYIWFLVFPFFSFTAGKLGEAWQEIQKEREKIAEEFAQFAHVDPVTNLNTKNEFYLNLNEEMAKADRHAYPLSIMLIQIQYFNELKLLYKKEEVANVLEALAKQIREIMRVEDKKYRLDEDSFAIILPFTDLPGAELVKNRLKNKLEELSINIKTKNKSLSFNFKIAVKKYNQEECVNPFQLKILVEKELEYDV